MSLILDFGVCQLCNTHICIHNSLAGCHATLHCGPIILRTDARCSHCCVVICLEKGINYCLCTHLIGNVIFCNTIFLSIFQECKGEGGVKLCVEAPLWLYGVKEKWRKWRRRRGGRCMAEELSLGCRNDCSLYTLIMLIEMIVRIEWLDSSQTKVWNFIISLALLLCIMLTMQNHTEN